ncbi:hypothetical protein THASP1DRAFT_31604 [Thamnocephalis sphaerospora]|uniref:Uncharacterized protein n=1 Tax=Thamnocephalis sphaerospora TaxID=78915 RepID=A0A4P9XL66_9FUNG|nr:hypothetical protein THASP1DRAFT_31604 [Thamnocephalis sphaerospora]|eukprot:RKP06587.1 hypothetical protein THASP1DRAFT_31604 [Thamnocephalis sphaerospora]
MDNDADASNVSSTTSQGTTVEQLRELSRTQYAGQGVVVHASGPESNPKAIAMHTYFTCTVLRDTLLSIPAQGSTLGGLHTTVVYTIFRTGYLIVTHAFSPTMKLWLPVLFTWAAVVDAANYRHHYRTLLAAMAEALGREPTTEEMTQVTLLSEAQLHGFLISFAERRQHGSTSATLQAQASTSPPQPMANSRVNSTSQYLQSEVTTHTSEACRFLRHHTRHFQAAPDGLLRVCGLGDAKQAGVFATLGQRLLGSSNAPQQARSEQPERTPEAALKAMYADFPHLSGWLAGWLRPEMARALLPWLHPLVTSQSTRAVARHSASDPFQRCIYATYTSELHDMITGFRLVLDALHDVECEFTQQLPALCALPEPSVAALRTPLQSDRGAANNAAVASVARRVEEVLAAVLATNAATKAKETTAAANVRPVLCNQGTESNSSETGSGAGTFVRSGAAPVSFAVAGPGLGAQQADSVEDHRPSAKRRRFQQESPRRTREP